MLIRDEAGGESVDFTVERTGRIPIEAAGKKRSPGHSGEWSRPGRGINRQLMGFEDVEVETDGMKIAAENDMFTLYRVEEGIA